MEEVTQEYITYELECNDYTDQLYSINLGITANNVILAIILLYQFLKPMFRNRGNKVW